MVEDATDAVPYNAVPTSDAGFQEAPLYSSLSVRGFRCLDDFCIEGLGRVNLLVGANNCGKTSILESVLLLSSASPSVVPGLAIRRGESRAITDPDMGRTSYAVDISQLFACHDLTSEVVVSADHCQQDAQARASDEVRLRITDAPYKTPTEGGPPLPFADASLPEVEDGVTLQACWSTAANDFAVPLTARGELLMRSSTVLRRARDHGSGQFIGSNGMTVARVMALLDDVVLSQDEQQVTHALNILEPRVERVASIASERDLSRGGPVGIFVKLKGVEKRVPIGSTGDGMWRMLGIALMLAKAKGGVLLIDEIDSGLHYTVMERMWQMVCEQAAALSVQVFATTHSRDCYESLAAVTKAEAAPTEGVTIQRIEQDRKRAVAVSGDAIAVVAERGLEIR